MDFPREPFLRIVSIEIRRRLPMHILTIFCAWPIFSLFTSAAGVRKTSLPYHSLSWLEAHEFAFFGMIILAPYFLVVGLLAAFISLIIFSIFASQKLLQPLEWRFSLIVEPLLLFLSLFFSSSLLYPAVLSHAVLGPFQFLPVWVVTTLLGLGVCIGSFLVGAPGARLRLLAFVAASGLLCPVIVASKCSWGYNKPLKPPLVLLGLDSLSHHDNISILHNWSKANKGTWYSYAVTPGLLTNSVWTSLITMEPVHQHKVFHIFQSLPQSYTNETLIDKAHKAGYRAVSIFPDQLTCCIGNQAGFDINNSGPIGWRQLATSYIENASILLPLIRPLLPKLPFSDVPPNHQGTFTYDLDRELFEIFSFDSDKRKTFVAAHLTYLHNPRFPTYMELSWDECFKVLLAATKSVQDRGLDWQDTDKPDDAIQLHEWKIKRLQKAVIHAIERTDFLKRGGCLLLFSDHGNREGITEENFWHERYHRVLLFTFGLETRDPGAPISLIDAGSLLGLAPRISAFKPVVEFSMAKTSEWPILARRAHIRWDGSIEFDDKVLKVIFSRLRSYQPWQSESQPKGPKVVKGSDTDSILLSGKNTIEKRFRHIR